MCYDGILTYDGRFNYQKACKEAFWLVDTSKKRQYEVWVFEFTHSTVQVERMTDFCGQYQSHMNNAMSACMQSMYKATVIKNGMPGVTQLGNVKDIQNLLTKTAAVA